MKLYLISQTEHNDYDTYDSAVVCAPNEETAAAINPANGKLIIWEMEKADWSDAEDWENAISLKWCSSRAAVNVKYIGEAASDIEQGVICVSFNAG